MEQIRKIKQIVLQFYRSGYFAPMILVILYLVLKPWYESKMVEKNSMIKSDMAFGKAQLVDMDSWAYKSGSYFEWKVYIGDRTI